MLRLGNQTRIAFVSSNNSVLVSYDIVPDVASMTNPQVIVMRDVYSTFAIKAMAISRSMNKILISHSQNLSLLQGGNTWTSILNN